MLTKEYMSHAFTLDREIKAKKEQIQQLKDIYTSVEETLFDSKSVNCDSDVNVEDLGFCIKSLIREYIVDIRRLLLIKHEIKKATESLENPLHRIIIEERYINLKIWGMVAKDNYMSRDTVYRLHRGALSVLGGKSY